MSSGNTNNCQSTARFVLRAMGDTNGLVVRLLNATDGSELGIDAFDDSERDPGGKKKFVALFDDPLLCAEQE